MDTAHRLENKQLSNGWHFRKQNTQLLWRFWISLNEGADHTQLSKFPNWRLTWENFRTILYHLQIMELFS